MTELIIGKEPDTIELAMHVLKFQSAEYKAATTDVVIRHDGLRYGPFSSPEHAAAVARKLNIPLDCIKVEPRTERDA